MTGVPPWRNFAKQNCGFSSPRRLVAGGDAVGVVKAVDSLLIHRVLLIRTGQPEHIAPLFGLHLGFCTCSDFQIIRAALYVAPEAAGRGIGRSLLRAWEEAARKHGIRIMRIHSGRNATGFYRKCGYRLEKEITLSNGIRADEMTKEL